MDESRDDTRTYRIMIVEDSETQAVLLTHLLEGEGWEVLWADSAETALDMLAEEAPDLIIIDYHLPGIQGDELCRRVKMNINTRSIPTLMLTIEDGSESELHGLESGADDYLPKYVDEDILLLRIKSLLRKSGEATALFTSGSSLFKRSRILAVDDSPTYLEFLEESFKADGIHMDSAASGAEALEKINQTKYDCILVDLVMPEIDGIQLCSKILDLRRSIAEPMVVLMLTAHETKEDMTRALEAGADDFVGKSNDISVIKARMLALLRRKFIQEDNQRIFEELKRKELEAERSRIQADAAQAKAVLAEKLQQTVQELEKEIEERKRMEKQIKTYSHELERSNRELELFAYAASHDLQEPLRAISSYLQLVERRYNNKLDHKGQDFIQRAVKGAKRMQDMINDLLTYSRITTRAAVFKTCSLEKILDRVLNNLSVAIEKSGALITREPLPQLACEESQFTRLLQNLCSNALKFCEKDRPEVHISAKEQDQHWLFSVKDNGIGIKAEHKEIIFHIFHRLHGRGEYPGTGIGLAICQKIVEQHGGTIWLESQPGEGSTFYFTIKSTEITHDATHTENTNE